MTSFMTRVARTIASWRLHRDEAQEPRGGVDRLPSGALRVRVLRRPSIRSPSAATTSQRSCRQARGPPRSPSKSPHPAPEPGRRDSAIRGPSRRSTNSWTSTWHARRRSLNSVELPRPAQVARPAVHRRREGRRHRRRRPGLAVRGAAPLPGPLPGFVGASTTARTARTSVTIAAGRMCADRCRRRASGRSTTFSPVVESAAETGRRVFRVQSEVAVAGGGWHVSCRGASGHVESASLQLSGPGRSLPSIIASAPSAAWRSSGQPHRTDARKHSFRRRAVTRRMDLIAGQNVPLAGATVKVRLQQPGRAPGRPRRPAAGRTGPGQGPTPTSSSTTLLATRAAVSRSPNRD